MKYFEVVFRCSFRGLFPCRDADDAVYARDGYDYDGYKLRVEFPRGGGGSFRGGRDRGGGGRDGGRPGRGPPARRSQYRVVVTGKLKKTYAVFFKQRK